MNPILKRTLTGISIGAIVIAAVLFSPIWLVKPVLVILIALAIAEFGALLRRKLPIASVAFGAAFLIGALMIACGIWTLARVAEFHGNVMLLYLVAVVKFSDVGGFACGLTSAKILKGGNHKLCPTISPGKSWEGLFGSILFSSIFSLSFIGVTHFGVGKAIAFGVIAALVGTAGDLVESKFKRWIGVKDSSAFSFTNGMGGILDMLDSLLFAPTILLAFV